MMHAAVLRAALALLSVGALAAADLDLAVDLRALPSEGLVHAELELPVAAALRYPRWVPGTHAPSGPIRNLVGLHCLTPDGAVVAWERDPRESDRFVLRPPAGATRLRVHLTYLANQPDANSEGVDVAATKGAAVLNWNCCLLYPEDAAPDQFTCAARATLPPGWGWGSALDGRVENGALVFAEQTLTTLIDRPLLIGADLLRVPLHDADGLTMALHVAGRGGQPPDERWLTGLRALPGQAQRLFGGAWTPRYEALLLLTGNHVGLEHADSSFNGFPPAAFADFSQARPWVRALIPHEFCHAWVGKHRRPQGMLTGDLHTTPDHEGLWVYEGLTEYLGRVLAVRAGLMTSAEWRRAIARDLHRLGQARGRHWRSLRDCCRATWALRAPSERHGDLRRGQDYYDEGALFWLAADVRLRRVSGGTRSLDDFCRAFFGPQGDRRPGFSETELVAALTALDAGGGWDARIARWIDSTGPLPATLDGSGWRLDDARPAPATVAAGDIDAEALDASLGLRLSDREVERVAPGSAAARAGLRAGDFLMQAAGEQDVVPTLARLLLARAPQEVSCTIVRDQFGQEVGLRVDPADLRLVRLLRADGDDLLAPILAPLGAAAAVPR